jgi:sugar/nucleoside kinase (ribokinase family)
VLRYRPDGEREHSLAGLGSPWTAEDLEALAPTVLRDATWVHAATQGSRDFGAEALRVLSRGGRRLVLDAQGPLREAKLGPLRLTGELGADLLAHVQVLKLSEEEANAAFGTLDPGEIAQRTGVAEVLVTLGSTGVHVAAGPDSGSISSSPVTGVDPTGAGDSFLALYADGRAEGLSPLAAAEAACADVSAVLAARLAASSGSIGRGRPVSQS